MGSATPTDVILAMLDPYMEEIWTGVKNYEFRKYRLPPTIQRIWFYRHPPHSAITHICEIDPVARTRNGPGDTPLPEDGVGNKEFNENHPDWGGYDYAYKILSTWELKEPLSLEKMMNMYGFTGRPRKWTALPDEIARDIVWNNQNKVRPEEGSHPANVSMESERKDA